MAYSLIFSRALGSRQRAVKLFDENRTQVEFINFSYLKRLIENPQQDKTLKDIGDAVMIIMWDRSLMSSQFLLFREHLNILQKEMSEWRPRTLRDYFNPGYTDRFTWWTSRLGFYFALLGVLFGCLAALGVLLSIIQTAYTILSYHNSKSSLSS